MQTDTSNKNFQLALEFVQYTNRSIFITGKAGTGKTTFLKYIKQHAHKNMAVVAPTGVAAINAGGVTIHSFFQLPFTPYIPTSKGFTEVGENITTKQQLLSKIKLAKPRIELIQQLEVLIIDEISMVRADVLDAIDTVLKHYRKQHSKPFGGLQVIFIGDMFQLPPVAPQQDWQILGQYYTSPYFFDSYVVKEMEPAYIELDKIYRQADAHFIKLLNKVRNNVLDDDAHELLKSIYNPNFEPTQNNGFITLTTHNSRADAINSESLQAINEPSFFYEATVEGEFSEKMYPIDYRLEFKQGAQVMFIKNDLDKAKRFFNGKIGTIKTISETEIWVQCAEEEPLIKVEKYRWENITYELNSKKNLIEEDVIGTFTQYPLRLAWAITIHKSQGLTFDKAIIDAGKAFAPGQVYVALSRCRTLEGIVLLSNITNSSLHADQHIIAFSKKQNTHQLENSLLFEKQLHQTNVLLSLFDFTEALLTAQKLAKLVTEQKATFNASAIDFAITTLQKLEQYQKFGKQFSIEIEKLTIGAELPENNQNLQVRLSKAAAWYLKELLVFVDDLNNSTALTNNKDVAKSFDNFLKEVFTNISFKIHLFKNVEVKFNFTAYQAAKQAFIVPNLKATSNAKGVNGGFKHPTHPELYDELRTYRDNFAEQMNEQTYMVLGNKTLDELATYLPKTKEDLEQITGFGKTKIKQFGSIFLQIITSYCEEKNLETLIHTKEQPKKITAPKKEEKPNTYEESFKLFKAGKTIKEIAKERGFAETTIEGHLSRYLKTGTIAITELIPLEKAATIIKALENFDKTQGITPIKNELGDDFSFGEIRLVQAHVDFVKEKEKSIS
ncbi:MAG: helix-turn-helix domain-containing protein [Chitinophagaceae bacterium]